MKIALIEDDPLIQIELKIVLNDLGHEVIGQFDCYEEVFENLDLFNQVDVAFIDIQLATSYDGTDVADLLRKKSNLCLVFLTSQIDERILAKSNQLKVDGFLAKPYRPDDIKICIARLPKKAITTDLNEVYLKDGHLFFKITTDDFLWAKAEDNYITIQTTKEKRLILLPLKEFTTKFLNRHIIRIHRSYVINTLKIDQVHTSEIKIGTQLIPIGDSYKSELFNLLNIPH
jgi:DNA-binding LytR/AlgR family response regulator